MGTIVFDSSTIISISDKCLINLLRQLAKNDKAEFLIPESVYRESVAKPMKVRRFELNAIRIKAGVEDGWLKIVRRTKEIRQLTNNISQAANTVFFVDKKPVRLIQEGETEALAIRKLLGAELVAIDERNTRMLIEDPHRLQKYLEFKYGEEVKISDASLEQFHSLTGRPGIVRSVELIALAYERGYFEVDLEKSRNALEAALYAAKYAGCAVSGSEIDDFLGRKK